MGAALNSGLSTQGGAGGKSMGDNSQPQSPQMGFGMDPNTGLPFGGNGLGMQPTPGVIGFGSSYDPSKDLNLQQPLPQANDMLGGNVMGFGGGQQDPSQWNIGIDWNSGRDFDQFGNIRLGGENGKIYKSNNDGTFTDPQGNRVYNNAKQSFTGGTQYDWQPATDPSINYQAKILQNAGFGGKSGGFGPAQSAPQPAPQGPQMRGGPAGQPITNPPINRFAPPNAPGVRLQKGIPVQQARTVQPNRYTRTRTR